VSNHVAWDNPILSRGHKQLSNETQTPVKNASCYSFVLTFNFLRLDASRTTLFEDIASKNIVFILKSYLIVRCSLFVGTFPCTKTIKKIDGYMLMETLIVYLLSFVLLITGVSSPATI